MAATIGHNSIDTGSREALKMLVDRIEDREEEKRVVLEEIRTIYAEAKSSGFDVKALRAIGRLRKQDADERAEHEAILETYMRALGMLASTPLGGATIARARVEAAIAHVRGGADAP